MYFHFKVKFGTNTIKAMFAEWKMEKAETSDIWIFSTKSQISGMPIPTTKVLQLTPLFSVVN